MSASVEIRDLSSKPHRLEGSAKLGWGSIRGDWRFNTRWTQEELPVVRITIEDDRITVDME